MQEDSRKNKEDPRFGSGDFLFVLDVFSKFEYSIAITCPKIDATSQSEETEDLVTSASALVLS